MHSSFVKEQPLRVRWFFDELLRWIIGGILQRLKHMFLSWCLEHLFAIFKYKHGLYAVGVHGE